VKCILFTAHCWRRRMWFKLRNNINFSFLIEVLCNHSVHCYSRFLVENMLFYYAILWEFFFALSSIQLASRTNWNLVVKVKSTSMLTTVPATSRIIIRHHKKVSFLLAISMNRVLGSNNSKWQRFPLSLLCKLQ
jgi:hypothetical protein